MTDGTEGFAEAAAIIAAVEEQSQRFETPSGDGMMVWRRWGQGEPIILIHGGGGSWMHWIRNILPLAQTRSVWCPDLPGFGISAPTKEGNIEAIAETVADGIDQLPLGDGKFDLVGFSFGSVTSSLVAGMMGERRIRNVVLSGVGAGVLGLSRGISESLTRWRNLSEEEARAAFRGNLEIQMIHDPAKVDGLALYLHEHNMRRMQFNRRNGMRAGIMMEALPHIHSRLVAIWGAQDALAATHFPEIIEIFEKIHPGLEKYMIPGAGHWVAFEVADEYNRILEKVLT